MRPLSLADIEVALQVLLARPAKTRKAAALALLAEAEQADAHRQATGQLHPQFGSGTLMSAALGHPRAARPAAYDRQVIGVLSILLRQISAHQSHHGM